MIMIMKSQLSTKSLIALRKALPVGGIRLIASRLQIDESTVSKALKGNGKNINTRVVEEALKVIEEARAKALELENKIAELS